MRKYNSFIPVIFLFAVIVVFFSPFFLQGKIPLPADALVGLYHPYRDLYANTNPNGIAYKNFLITDPIRQQYPWRYLAIQSEKEVVLPLWNPYSGAGEPLFANIQSALLYPLNLLLFVLPFTTGWSFLIMLQLVLGGISMYYYLKNRDLSDESSFLGSVSYIFSGFFVAWLTWNTLVQVALWLPVALLAVDKITHEKKGKLVFLWCIVLIFAMTLSFFAGHLQTYFYISLLVAAYTILRIFSQKEKTASIALFLGAVMNVLVLIFAQLFATIQLILQSARDTDQQFLVNKEGWFIPWQHLIQFFSPDFFGNPATLNYWGTWNYGEMVGYIGLIPLFFALYALLLRKSRTVVFFAGVALISLLFALPTFLAKLPFTLQIPFLATSQPTRLMVLIDFSLSVLAAYGFHIFLHNKKFDTKLFVLLGIFALSAIALWAYAFQKGISSELIVNLSVAKRNLFFPTALLIVLSVFIALWMLVQNKTMKRILVICLLVVVSVDLLRFGSKFNPFVNPEYVYPMTKTIAYLQEKSKNYPWRFLGIDSGNQKRILPPNISAYYKLYTLDTYNPLLLRNFQNYAAASEFGITNGDEFSFNRIIALNNYDSRLVSLAGVKYLASLSDIENSAYKLRLKEGGTRVYENTNVFPRAFVVYNYLVEPDTKRATKLLLDEKIDLRTTVILSQKPSFTAIKDPVKSDVTITSYRENVVEISVKTEREGLLLLTDTYYPTWKAKIDGKKANIIKTDVTFRGVVVPKGSHEVVFYTTIF